MEWYEAIVQHDVVTGRLRTYIVAIRLISCLERLLGKGSSEYMAFTVECVYRRPAEADEIPIL